MHTLEANPILFLCCIGKSETTALKQVVHDLVLNERVALVVGMSGTPIKFTEKEFRQLCGTLGYRSSTEGDLTGHFGMMFRSVRDLLGPNTKKFLPRLGADISSVDLSDIESRTKTLSESQTSDELNSVGRRLALEPGTPGILMKLVKNIQARLVLLNI